VNWKREHEVRRASQDAAAKGWTRKHAPKKER
jgi:hypothetical protein